MVDRVAAAVAGRLRELGFGVHGEPELVNGADEPVAASDREAGQRPAKRKVPVTAPHQLSLTFEPRHELVNGVLDLLGLCRADVGRGRRAFQTSTSRLRREVATSR